MKHIKLIGLVPFLLGSVVSAQTPTLVQHDSSSNIRSNSVTNAMQSPFCYHFQPPEPATQGNALIVGFQYQGHSVTPSMSDDKGDSYTVEESYYDSADNRTLAIAAALNVSAGARNLKLCFTGDPGGFVQAMVSEFSNVTSVDGQGSGNNGSGTAVTAGNLSPAATGDLIYQVTASFSSDLRQSSFGAGSQSNIAWNLLSADLMDGWAGQYGIYDSNGPINPTMSMGSSNNWASVAVLFKAGTAGSVPSGMRIVHLLHQNIPHKIGAGGNGSSFPNPFPIQFPCSGNLLVIVAGGGGANTNVYITGITDTNGNTWNIIGPATPYHNGTNDTVRPLYAPNAACSSSNILTTTWNTNIADETAFLYDIAGAAASPFDTSNGLSNGDQSSNTTGSYSPPFTLTPAGPGELILAEIMWDLNTAVGLSTNSGLAFFDANRYDGESVNGPCPLDENNGWGHVYTNGNGAVNFTWSVLDTNEAVGGTASIAAAFKPAGTVTPPAPPTQLTATVH
jgi:hypothetical protein